MKATILIVGKVKDKNIDNKINEYLTRMNNSVNIQTIKDSNKLSEGKEIIEIINKKSNSTIFIMSEEGTQLPSFTFSQVLKKATEATKEIIFVIGGPEGIDDSVKVYGHVLALSKMTFPHELCLLFLVEQVYRATTIWENKKYHK
jgi:23S rRNA (pseudouridine1915-N3)-methyltransferase